MRLHGYVNVGYAVVLACLVTHGPAPASEAGASDHRASTWPTLHKDYQRSGYTDEVVGGPYQRKWYRDFHGEMIATRVEAIVAEGK